MIQSVKTTNIKKNKIKENETTLFAYIRETTNTDRQRFLIGMDNEEKSENKLNLSTESFIPSVTLVASLCVVLSTMYHRMQRAPSLLQRNGTWSKSCCYVPRGLEESTWSAELQEWNKCKCFAFTPGKWVPFIEFIASGNAWDSPSIYCRTGYRRRMWSLAHQRCESEPGIDT